MATFHILDLYPLEYSPRYSSLKFLTQVFRNLGDMKGLDKTPVTVYNIDGKRYLEDGNHRSSWNLLNGIFTIEGNEEIPLKSDRVSTLRAYDCCRERGVKHVVDLARLIHNPDRFTMEGPVTHLITPEQLRDPGFFLKL